MVFRKLASHSKPSMEILVLRLLLKLHFTVIFGLNNILNIEGMCSNALIVCLYTVSLTFLVL